MELEGDAKESERTNLGFQTSFLRQSFLQKAHACIAVCIIVSIYGELSRQYRTHARSRRTRSHSDGTSKPP